MQRSVARSVRSQRTLRYGSCGMERFNCHILRVPWRSARGQRPVNRPRRDAVGDRIRRQRLGPWPQGKYIMKGFRSRTFMLRLPFVAFGVSVLACSALPDARAQGHAPDSASTHSASQTQVNRSGDEGATQGGTSGSSIGQGLSSHDPNAKRSNQRSGPASGSGHDAGASTNSY